MRDNGPAKEVAEHGSRATFCVADVVLRYEALQPRVRFVTRESIRPFMVADGGAPDCILSCDVGSVDPSPAPVAFQAPVWELRRLPDGGEEIVFRSTAPWARLRMNDDFSAGTLTHSPERDRPWEIHPGDYPIAEYVICRLMGKRGGLHLHASTVLFDDRAYVFLGHSGAGKSTIAHIAEQAGGEVLSDDRTVITVTDQGPIAWGTPWHGSLQRTSAKSQRVAGIALLVQSERNVLSRLANAVAAKEIFVRLIQPRLDQREVENTLGAIERLLAHVPLHKFEFAPTLAAIDTLHHAWRDAPG